MSDPRVFLIRPEKLNAVAMDSFRCAYCRQWVYAEAYQYHLRQECAEARAHQASAEGLNSETA